VPAVGGVTRCIGGLWATTACRPSDVKPLGSDPSSADIVAGSTGMSGRSGRTVKVYWPVSPKHASPSPGLGCMATSGTSDGQTYLGMIVNDGEHVDAPIFEIRLRGDASHVWATVKSKLVLPSSLTAINQGL